MSSIVAGSKVFSRRQGPVITVLAACLLFCGVALLMAGGNPMAFVDYDGHFAYQIALRGSEATGHLDVPAYRYQRIFYPLLARLLAAGQPELVPWTLIAINVAAITGGTAAAAHVLERLGVSRWYALVYGLYGGQFVALRTNLTEPLAMALVVLAIAAYLQKRWGLTALALALAALTRELTIVFWVALLIHRIGSVMAQGKRVERSVILLALAPIPLMVWETVLWLWLGRPGIGAGGAGATSFSLVPLGGWLQIAEAHTAAFLLLSVVLAPMAVAPTLAGIFVSVRRIVGRQADVFTLMLFFNCLVILFLPFSSFRETAAMVRLMQGVAMSFLFLGALTGSKRILNYSLLWLATNALWLTGVAS